MEITRNQFMELLDMKEGEGGMELADELHYNGQSYWEIAKDFIAQEHSMLSRIMEEM